MTGAGGFLQSVWAGYGGIRFEHPGILTIRQPAPLPNSTRLRLRGVHFLGSRLDITAENSGWRVELNGGSVLAPTIVARNQLRRSVLRETRRRMKFTFIFTFTSAVFLVFVGLQSWV